MKTYRDGDDEYAIIRPGEQLPGQYTGPAEGGDFAWMRSTWPARFRGRQKGKSLKILNDNLRGMTEYNDNTAAHIRSKHAIIEAHQEERLLPLKAEQRQAELQLSIVRTHGAIQDEIERQERAKREHRSRITQLKGDAKEAKSHNKQARRARRRARDAERGRSSYDRPPHENGAEPFRRHYRTQQQANANLREGAWRIQEILGLCAAENRPPTPEEIEEMDAARDAAHAAADEVRRTGASDLPPVSGRR